MKLFMEGGKERNPLLISRWLYWVLIAMAVFGTLLELVCADFTQRLQPMWVNLSVALGVAWSVYHTRLGKVRTNMGLVGIGIAFAVMFCWELVRLSFSSNPGSRELIWLLYDLYLMIVLGGMLGFLVDRRWGILMGLTGFALGGIYFYKNPTWFFDQYGWVWVFVVSWFLLLVGNYRLRLELLYTDNRQAREELSAQKAALATAASENENALRLLHARHQQLIEQEKEVFHERMVHNLADELGEPSRNLVEKGGAARAQLALLGAFLQQHPEALDANDRAELDRVLKGLRINLGGVRGEAMLGRRYLEDLVR